MVYSMSQYATDLERCVSLSNEYLLNEPEGLAVDRCVDVFGTNSQVILSAPHAVKHLSKDGLPKAADASTGGLARFVCERTGFVAVVSSGGWTSANANHVLEGWCPYRATLKKIKLPNSTLVDLHGMSDKHGADVCIGTGPTPQASAEVVSFAIENLKKAGLTVAVNTPFSASNPGTITAWAQQNGFRAFQLEARAALRHPWANPQTSLYFAEVLSDLVKGLSNI